MNWDAMGAIGEIIGSMAVILTIVYLSMQIRQTTSPVSIGQVIETVSGPPFGSPSTWNS